MVWYHFNNLSIKSLSLFAVRKAKNNLVKLFFSVSFLQHAASQQRGVLMKAFLILEDGHIFTGTSIGSEKEVISEIVFTTSMTGYLETLTDPSFVGQSVIMTYPLIGNYGVCDADMESKRAWPVGFIIREVSGRASNFRSDKTILEYLKINDITGITGIDTRALTRILREEGAMNGMITTNETFNLEDVIAALKNYRIVGAVKKVTCTEKRTITYDAFLPTDVELAKMTYMASPAMLAAIEKAKANGISPGEIAMCSMLGTKGVEKLIILSENKEDTMKHRTIALMDFGSKRSIEHCLLKRGCNLAVYPAYTKADEILSTNPDGIMLSNGPGDPTDCPEIIEEVKKLYQSGVPIFAICLGHQFMALANGFKTEKMKYGHRGGNHPVKDMETGRVYISSQNHGYVVKENSIDKEIAAIRFINPNDNSVEGLRYKNKQVYTVQFHPEACAGPQDTDYLFDEFMSMIG